MTKGLVIFGLGLVAALGIARVPDRATPISLQHVGTDKAGKLLAHAVTEDISASGILRVGQDTDDGWKVVLMTSEAQDVTFYSVVLVRKQFDDVFDQYVFAFQGICAADQASACARGIVDRVQEPIDQFESDWRDLSGAQAAAERAG